MDDDVFPFSILLLSNFPNRADDESVTGVADLSSGKRIEWM